MSISCLTAETQVQTICLTLSFLSMSGRWEINVNVKWEIEGFWASQMHCEDKVSSLMNPTMMYIVKSLSIIYQERIRGNVTVTKWIKIVLTALKNTFPSPSAISSHT